MKKIHVKNHSVPRLDSVYTRDRFPVVVLGNGVTITMRNKKAFNAAIASVNRSLTVKMYVLNEIYIEVFIHHRRAWVGLSASPSGLDPIAGDWSRLVECARSFDLLADRSHYVNGATFVFRHISFVAENLTAVCDHLAAWYRRADYWAGLPVLIALRARIDQVQKDCKEIGKEYQVKK